MHKVRSLVQVKEPGKQTGTVTAQNDEVRIEVPGEPRDLLGRFTDEKPFVARRVIRLERPGELG